MSEFTQARNHLLVPIVRIVLLEGLISRGMSNLNTILEYQILYMNEGHL